MGEGSETICEASTDNQCHVPEEPRSDNEEAMLRVLWEE